MKFLGAAFISLFSFNVYAADHIDGPVTTSHQVTDITDFFAFVPKDQPGKLVLALNTYPFVGENGHFSEKVRYTFHNKKLQIKDNRFNVSAEDFNVVCTFKGEHEEQEMECKSNTGLSSSTKKSSLNSTGDFQSYFGRVADPLLLNSTWFSELAMKGKLLPPLGEKENLNPAENTMALLSALNITLVIDMKSVFPNAEGSQYASAVSSEGEVEAGVFKQMDWMGKPEVTNFMLQMPIPGETIRDDYNKEKPFHVSADGKARYQKRFEEKLLLVDGADGQKDWKTEEEKFTRLLEVLNNDYLIVDLDPSKTSTGDNYLEIENAFINNRQSETTGGRQPTDDIMDRIFTLFVNSGDGKTGTIISDGINRQFPTPYTGIRNFFPYQGISYYDAEDPNSTVDDDIKKAAAAKRAQLLQALGARAVPAPNPAGEHGHGHNHD